MIIKYPSLLTVTGLLLTFAYPSAYAADNATLNNDNATENTAQQNEAPTQNSKNIEVEKEKHKMAEDPTKVISQVGVSYADEKVKFSGSLSLGAVNKINASVSADGDEWRIGGSWLFDVGIVNVNFGKKEFDDDTKQNNYSIGTFVPLSYFGFTPWGTQIFIMGGYTYNDGELTCHSNNECGTDNIDFDDLSDGALTVSSSSSSGYLGTFALKPLTDKWRLIGIAAGSLGSNDYHGYLLALGTGYSLTKRQSVAAYGFLQDNSFGRDERLGIVYKYQFN